jgi:predicted HD superfamily hydrolase involved in NAD metabolism
MNYTNKDLFLNKKQKEYIEAVKRKMKSVMPAELFTHITGTLQYSKELAKVHLESNVEKYPVPKSNYSSMNDLFNKLCLACVLHDYGKVFKYEELIKIAEEEKLGLSGFEFGCRSIIHSFITPFLLSRDFDIEDEVILKAIRSHTIGSVSMNIVDRILYIADKVEPSRNYLNSKDLRELSLKDIDLGLLEVYKSNIIYVINKNNTLHPETSNIWNYICGGFKNAI